MLADDPTSCSVPVPLPVIVTPEPEASVSLPFVTVSVVVIDAVSRSSIVIALPPENVSAVSSVAAIVAGAVITGVSLTGLTLRVTVAVVVAPSASLSV